MVKQEIYQDEVAAYHAIKEFFDEVEEEYGRKAIFFDEYRERPIAYDEYDIEGHITDDRLIQLVFDNRLIAFCFLRKNDGNYNEVTFVKIEKNDA